MEVGTCYDQAQLRHLNTAELRAYVLLHRDDNDALYELSDRVHQTGIKLHPSAPLTKVIANKQTTQPDEPGQ